MAKITTKFENITGPFDTGNMKLMCFSNRNQMHVELCIIDKMNISIAPIRLYSHDNWLDAKDTFPDAKVLGDEIAARWNNHAPKSIDEIRSEFENDIGVIQEAFDTWDGQKYGQNELNILWQVWQASRTKALEIKP